MQGEFRWLEQGGEKVGLVGAGGGGLEWSVWEEIGGKGLCTEWIILNEGGWQRK